MSRTQYKYRIQPDPDAAWLKAFNWLWGHPAHLTTCTLFWGTLFAPLALFVHLVAFLIRPAVVYFTARHEAKTQARVRQEMAAARAGESEEPSRLSRMLGGISSGMGSFWAEFHTPLTWLAIALAGVVAVGTVGGFVLLCILFPVKMLVVLAWLAGLALFVATGIMVVGRLERSRRFKASAKQFGRRLKFSARAVHANTCAEIVMPKQAQNARAENA